MEFPADHHLTGSRSVPATPVKRAPLFFLLFFALMTLAALCWQPSATLAAPEPSLSEEQAKQIASSQARVADALSRHPELERRARYLAEDAAWEVSWSNPANGRNLIIVRVDDRRAAILDSDIESEVWLGSLPLQLESEVVATAREQQQVQDELDGREDVETNSDYDIDGVWTVSFHDDGNEVARVLIDDDTGNINEVMTGPQVAWQMARGYDGAFGRVINNHWLWLSLCLLFLAPFVDVRRPFRLIHLDLLVLLSFSVSHYFFNEGRIFTSVPLALPPLLYLFGRLLWLGVRRRAAVTSFLHLNFPPLVMLVGLVALVAFRLALNIFDSNVVDVGYSGVIGADLIQEGKSPYGNFPEDNGNGDTYGPLNYLLYIPFEKLLAWSGSWDDLPAAHATAIFFDLLTIAGLYMAGRGLTAGRWAGNRMGLALAYGWAAYPYTTFVQNCNVNDAIVAAFLVWGFVLIRQAPLAGLLLGFAAMIKFFPAILGPLWASFPDALRGWGRRTLFVFGFAIALALTLPVIFLGEGIFTTFWERSLSWQMGRESPFSVWGQHSDVLGGVQRLGLYALAALAALLYIWPRRKTAVMMAALSAALIVGFQILQTHWFYLYIPWFFPLALIAFLLSASGEAAPARGGEIGRLPGYTV